MTDDIHALATLKRPRLLVRAARLGVEHYRRGHLRSVLGCLTLPDPSKALAFLVEIEARLDADRNAGAATYSPQRHVAVLIALMAEARSVPLPGATEGPAPGIT